MTVAGGVAVSQAQPALVLTGQGAEGPLTLPALPPCRGHGGSRMEADSTCRGEALPVQGRCRVVARPALGKDGFREAGAQHQVGLTAREHVLPPCAL